MIIEAIKNNKQLYTRCKVFHIKATLLKSKDKGKCLRNRKEGDQTLNVTFSLHISRLAESWGDMKT